MGEIVAEIIEPRETSRVFEAISNVVSGGETTDTVVEVSISTAVTGGIVDVGTTTVDVKNTTTSLVVTAVSVITTRAILGTVVGIMVASDVVDG